MQTKPVAEVTQLRQALGPRDYFTLAFGTMVGVGWLLVMDDWLRRGGPGGAMVAFLAAGLLLAPIGFVYGRLVQRFPQAGGELAFARAARFPAPAAFLTGWLMTLAYLIVCPWEAVAIGKIAAYLLPALDSVELYRVAGQPVFLPRLLLGLALVASIGGINFRGVRLSAGFQNWTTGTLLAATAVFAALGFSRGQAGNLRPLFAHRDALVSIVLMLQVVPYFMTGFESVSKSSEEARARFVSRDFGRAIFLALGVGSLFYVVVVAVAAAVAPWPQTAGERFATAAAFQRVFGRHGVTDLIFVAALASLLKIYNGNLLAATRLLFALGRCGLLPSRLGQVHPRFATPAAAVIAATVASAVAALLGDAVLVPISEVGSLASACGWLAACVAFLCLEKSGRVVAALGALVALALVLMKFLPFVPGHFGRWELGALCLWLVLGWLFSRRAAGGPPAISTAILP